MQNAIAKYDKITYVFLDTRLIYVNDLFLL